MVSRYLSQHPVSVFRRTVAVFTKSLSWSLFCLGRGSLQVILAQLLFAICLCRTFDQRMFDFHGNCEYVLARGKMSRTDTFAVIVR